jgi:hypothetical protein
MGCVGIIGCRMQDGVVALRVWDSGFRLCMPSNSDTHVYECVVFRVVAPLPSQCAPNARPPSCLAHGLLFRGWTSSPLGVRDVVPS